jgi:hypothetical protein
VEADGQGGQGPSRVVAPGRRKRMLSYSVKTYKTCNINKNYDADKIKVRGI